MKPPVSRLKSPKDDPLFDLMSASERKPICGQKELYELAFAALEFSEIEAQRVALKEGLSHLTLGGLGLASAQPVKKPKKKKKKKNIFSESDGEFEIGMLYLASAHLTCGFSIVDKMLLFEFWPFKQKLESWAHHSAFRASAPCLSA